MSFYGATYTGFQSQIGQPYSHLAEAYELDELRNGMSLWVITAGKDFLMTYFHAIWCLPFFYCFGFVYT